MAIKTRKFESSSGDNGEMSSLLEKNDDSRNVASDLGESQDSLTTFVYKTWDAAVLGVCWLLYGLHHDTSVELWMSVLFIIAETWQLLSFAFFKRVEFDWNHNWSFWLSNALSWSSNFLGQSTSGFFAAIGWVGMIVLLAVFAVYGQRKLRWIWPMKAFSLWLLAGVSFMYIPVAGSLFRMIFGCLQSDVEHWDYPGLTCWSGTHIAYACISIVLLPFFIFCSCVVAVTYFELNPNQREDAGDKVSASARAHARGDLLNIVLRTILLFCFITFGSFQHNHWPLALLIVFCGCALTYYQIAYMPYYNVTLQVAAVFQALVVLWSGICVVITTIRGSSDHGAIYLLYFCLPLMILIAILAVKARMDQVLYWGNEKLTKPHLVELKARLVMRDGMHKTNLDEAWVDHTDDYSAYIKNQLWKQVEAIFQLGVSRFPEDPLLHLGFAGFYLFYSHNKPLAYRELSSAQSLPHAFDVKFILFLYQTRAELETTWGHTSDVQSYIEFKERKNVADNASRLAARSMFDFWTELLRSAPNVSRLIRLGNVGRQAIAQAQVNFERLLQINATSVPVLRSYGGFIIDFHGDINTSSQLLHRADELEDARSNMVSTDLAGMSFLDQQKSTLDIFDERNAVVGMSVEKDTFAQIISLNGSCRRMFGYSLNSELLHRNISVFIPEPIQSMHDDIVAEFLSRNTTSILNTTRVVLALHKNGTIFPINLFIRWADTSASKVIGVMSRLQTDDEQIMFDRENNSVVTYCTQNAYTWFGYNREMLVAREIYLGGLIPNLAMERAITGKDKRRREMLVNRASQKSGVIIPAKHHTSGKLFLMRVWITQVAVRGREVSFIRMSRNILPDNLTGEENPLGFTEEELAGEGIIGHGIDTYFSYLADSYARNNMNQQKNGASNDASETESSDSDSDDDHKHKRRNKGNVKIGGVEHYSDSEDYSDADSGSDRSSTDSESASYSDSDSDSDHVNYRRRRKDKRRKDQEESDDDHAAAALATNSKSILATEKKKVNNVVDTTAQNQMANEEKARQNEMMVSRTKAQQRLETSAALTMAYVKKGQYGNKRQDENAESDKDSHVAESYVGSDGGSQISGTNSISSSLFGNEGGGHVSGHRLINAFIHDENEQLTNRLSRVSKFALLTCFIIFGCWLAMYLVTDTAMSDLETQFNLLTLASHRRYVAFLMAHLARTIDLGNLGYYDAAEITLTHNVLKEQVDLFEALEQVLYDDSRLSQAAKDFLYVPSIQVVTLVGTTTSLRNFNLREVGQSYLANAFRLTMVDPTTLNANNTSPMYYILENVPSSITQAYTTSVEHFKEGLDNIYVDVWSIEIVTYGIALLVIAVFIIFIFRPTIAVVEKSKADVLILFLSLPRPVVRLLQRRFLTALRNQGDEEEDDEEGSMGREKAADLADDVSEADSSMSGMSGDSGQEDFSLKAKDIDALDDNTKNKDHDVIQVSQTRQSSLTAMHNHTIRVMAAKYAFFVIYCIVYTIVIVIMTHNAFMLAGEYTNSIVGASHRQIFLDQASYFLREHNVMPKLDPVTSPYMSGIEEAIPAASEYMSTGTDGVAAPRKSKKNMDINVRETVQKRVQKNVAAQKMKFEPLISMLPDSSQTMDGNHNTIKAYFSISQGQLYTRALLYGNDELNIVAATDASQTTLLYSNICTAFSQYTASEMSLLQAVHAPVTLSNFNTNCASFRNGINIRGMQEPIVVAIMLGFQTATTETAGLLSYYYKTVGSTRYDVTRDGARVNFTGIPDAGTPAYNAAMSNIVDIQTLVHNYIDVMQSMSLNDYRANAMQNNEDFDNFRKIFLICFVIVLFILHLILLNPIFAATNESAKQTLALLLIIPPDVVAKVSSVSRFVRNYSKKQA